MSVLDVICPIAARTEINATIVTAWRDGLLAVRDTKIKPRWDNAVGTDAKWLARVAGPSNNAYKPFVSQTFISKRGRNAGVIRAVQLKKLTQASTKAIAAFDASMTTSTGGFSDAVANKTQNWADKVHASFGMTGDRVDQVRGPSSVIARAAEGDQSFRADLVGGNTMAGEPQPEALTIPQRPYLHYAIRRSFGAALAGKLTQFGVLLLETYVTDPVDMNTILDRLLKGFILEDQYIDNTNNFIHFEGLGPYTLHLHLNNQDLLA